MFSHLTDLAYKRSKIEAAGFYIAYLGIILIVASIIGAIVGGIAGEDSDAFSNGVRMGTLASIVVCIGLSFIILRAKKLSSRVGLNVLAILAGLLALLGGGVLGLIIPAVLTTKGHKKRA